MARLEIAVKRIYDAPAAADGKRVLVDRVWPRGIRKESAHLTLSVAWLLGIDPGQPCLDFGGGHGVLVRMMRDLGLDFRWSDKFGKNLFAAGFEGDAANRYALVTAFEVFEHFEDVGPELRRLFSPGHGAVLVSTLLHDRPARDWWYWCPETGQHLAFYSRRTMAHIANEFGYEAIANASAVKRTDEGIVDG